MIKYSKDEFFSFKSTLLKPVFLQNVEHTTSNINNSEIIENIIEQNKITIESNISRKYESKKKSARNIKNAFGKQKYVKQETTKSIKSCLFSKKLNQLTNKTFDKIGKDISEILNGLEEELFEELSVCLFDRVIYEYNYTEMYVKVISSVSNKKFMDILCSILKLKFNNFLEVFSQLSDKEIMQDIFLIEKKKFMGLVLCISHMFNYNLLEICYFLEKLKCENTIFLEMICKVLYITGKNIKNPESTIDYLRSLTIKSSKLRFEIQNVLDLQKNNWKLGDMKFMNNIKDNQITKVQVPLNLVKEIVSKYKNDNLKNINGLDDETLGEFSVKTLDYLFERNIDCDILKFTDFCKNNNFPRQILNHTLSYFNENLQDLQIDIPNIQSKIKIFSESLETRFK